MMAPARRGKTQSEPRVSVSFYKYGGVCGERDGVEFAK